MSDTNSARSEFIDENEVVIEENPEQLEFDVEVEVSFECPEDNDDKPVKEDNCDKQNSAATSSNVESLSVPVAAGSSYQMFSQSMCLLAQNAVNNQMQLTTAQQTVTSQDLQQVISSQSQKLALRPQNSQGSLQDIISILTSLS